mmetsp:Transcript_11493/g.36428  ORF Transcript_11493/g.36428 Transcript_11493/m.36428 type:complete len:204 (-) Transcript_11493:458-1069(-)
MPPRLMLMSLFCGRRRQPHTSWNHLRRSCGASRRSIRSSSRACRSVKASCESMKRKALTAESSCSRGARGKGSTDAAAVKEMAPPPPPGAGFGGPTQSIIMWPARSPTATRLSGTSGSPVSIARWIAPRSASASRRERATQKRPVSPRRKRCSCIIFGQCAAGSASSCPCAPPRTKCIRRSASFCSEMASASTASEFGRRPMS